MYGRYWILWALQAVLAALLTALAAGGDAQAARQPHAGGVHGIAWAVQISDLHISRYAHPDIAPDLGVFGASVLAGLRPSALLLTGDLVDAKTANLEGSKQHEEEWQAYSRAWRHMASAAGLSHDQVIDLRGNHDVFDAVRGGPDDPFSEHSAAAAALGAAGAAARARVVRLPPRLLLRAEGGGGSAAVDEAARECPAAVLVGIDASPDVRMYAYTNFFGVLNASALADVARALDEASAAPAHCGGAAGPAPLVGFTHYPLGVISSAPRPGLWRGGGRELARLLARHRAAAHLSGHLHALAGPFMFRTHEPAARSHLAALPEFEAGDWKESRRWRLLAFDGPIVTIADYDFRGRRVHSLEPSAVVGSHVVVVTHASVSGGSGEAAAAAAGDGGGVPNVRALVLPRAPAAPRVAAAQLQWACGASPQQEGAVSGTLDLEAGPGHGAVVELGAAAGARPGHRRRGRGNGGGGGGGGGAAGADDSGGGGGGGGNQTDAGVLYLGVLGGHIAVGCGQRLWVQAVVTDVTGDVSSSPWRQVAQDLAAATGAHAAGPAGEAELARPGWRTRFLLGSLDWARRARSIQVLGWAFHLVAMLLLPRFCGGAIISAHARLAYPLLGRSPSLMRLASGALAGVTGAGSATARIASGNARGGGGGGGGARGGGAGRRVLGACAACCGAAVAGAWRSLLLLVLWPLRVLAECWARCRDDRAFAAMLAFNGVLLAGPWHLAPLSGGEAGLGAVMPWGLLMRPQGGGLALYRCADPSLGGSVMVWMDFIPLTLWLAHVSNSYAHADHKPPGPLLRLAHAAALAPIAALWARWMMRIVSTYGAAPILAGPATGWLPLLAYAWLRLSWRQPEGGWEVRDASS